MDKCYLLMKCLMGVQTTIRDMSQELEMLTDLAHALNMPNANKLN